jgi:RNA polymerase sigma factor for flagellar operon FliA
MTEDEKVLWGRYKESKTTFIRNEIAKMNINLVRFIVEKVYFASALASKDDLFNIGAIGLIEAVEKYDPDRGIKFVTYAYFRIYGSIMDYLREADWAPRSVKEKSSRLEKAYTALMERGFLNPTDEQVAKEMGLDIKSYYALIDGLHINKVYSIDELFSNDGAGTPSCHDCIDDNTETKELLARIIDTSLDQRERNVLALYYYEGLTLKEISKTMDLTEARISQIHAQAISKIKAKLAVEKSINIY